MGNAFSIAAATLTLRNVLSPVAADDYSTVPADARPINQIEVTTLPPDQARPATALNRVNLFLYKTEISGNWRNMDLPRRGRPGALRPPPLGLVLHYIITAYAENDNDLIGQVLLGGVMRVLHDHPFLSREEIDAAFAASELGTQVDQVRITEEPLSIDELSKLWSGFQSEYRLSVGYQMGAVLIESDRSKPAPLPVLVRGAADRGPVVVAGPGPTLRDIAGFVDPATPDDPPRVKPAAEPGDIVVLKGSNFGGAEMTAFLTHDRVREPRTLALALRRDDRTVRFALPDSAEPLVPRDWPAGFYAIELRVSRPDTPAWTTNRLSLPLAVQITSISPVSQPVGAQPFTLTVSCTPQIFDSQDVVLLLGDQAFPPSAIAPPPDGNSDTTLEISVDELEPGTYVVRLRVDGVDSLPIDFTTTPPQFDTAQMLTVGP